MKAKILILLLLTAVLSGCGAKPKVLIAYYSQSGNTRAVAEQIQARFGGDMYEIALATPYPDGEAETIEVVGRQREAGNLPELSAGVENMGDYDVVFLGTPIWFGGASLPVLSFVAAHNFAGKTVIPFYTCGGGDAGTFVGDISPYMGDAVMFAPFGNNRAERTAGTHTAKVAEYLDGLAF